MTRVEIEWVLGSILNLIRYKPAPTLEEANARLRLIDQIVLKAFRDVKKTPLVVGKRFTPSMPRSGEQRENLDQSRQIR
ncbi:MAG TPA: hypothetical protein VK479_03370, partial [Micropepsaceae bacterium]|nr:hypothetical protein [Micropepsaceae bacterium]